MFYEEDERLTALYRQPDVCKFAVPLQSLIFWALYGCSGTSVADVSVRYSDQTKRSTVMFSIKQKAQTDVLNETVLYANAY